MYGKGYGMPSSHAQFATFFSLTLTLFLLHRQGPPPPASLPARTLLSTLSLLCAAAVAASRIYLNYHTPHQVLMGCCAGAVSALAWYGVTEGMRRTGWVEWGLETRVARWGMVRDLVVREGLADAGWERWEGERRRRRKGVEKRR